MEVEIWGRFGMVYIEGVVGLGGWERRSGKKVGKVLGGRRSLGVEYYFWNKKQFFINSKLFNFLYL